MNKEIAAKAMKSIEKMVNVMDEKQKDHFASVLTLLTECYGPDAKWRGALIMADGQRVFALGINANEYELAGLLQEANGMINANLTAEAPAHGMYN